jgi:hypothetical protein
MCPIETIQTQQLTPTNTIEKYRFIEAIINLLSSQASPWAKAEFWCAMDSFYPNVKIEGDTTSQEAIMTEIVLFYNKH